MVICCGWACLTANGSLLAYTVVFLPRSFATPVMPHANTSYTRTKYEILLMLNSWIAAVVDLQAPSPASPSCLLTCFPITLNMQGTITNHRPPERLRLIMVASKNMQ
jgi:hypothetical protein